MREELGVFESGHDRVESWQRVVFPEYRIICQSHVDTKMSPPLLYAITIGDLHALGLVTGSNLILSEFDHILILESYQHSCHWLVYAIVNRKL